MANTGTENHSDACIGHASQCLAENLVTDGREAEMLEGLTAWGIPQDELIASWLAEGTVACICN